MAVLMYNEPNMSVKADIAKSAESNISEVTDVDVVHNIALADAPKSAEIKVAEVINIVNDGSSTPSRSESGRSDFDTLSKKLDDTPNSSQASTKPSSVFNDEHDKKVEAPFVEIDESIPPPPKSISEKSNIILDILERYRMSTTNGAHKVWNGRPKVLAQVEENLRAGSVIRLVLPAFPFKSPNKVHKVLGTLPDMAEEIALQHLHGLCTMIQEVHEPGANLSILSDGLCYNDILGVSDLEVWRYGEALRKLAVEKKCFNVKFARLADLLGSTYQEVLNEEMYLRHAADWRNSLIDRNMPEGFDVDKFIANDADATLTYRGYIKFLETDLKLNEMPSEFTKRKTWHEHIAKTMMRRGKAFASAIASRFGDHIRLSIHDSSNDSTKLSVSLLPQNGNSMTPWHSCLVRAVDGTITMSHGNSVPARTHDLIFQNGQASYFRERSDLFDWPDMSVKFDYMYPTGIIISAKNPESRYSLHNVHMQKVRGLAELCSPIVLRGFSGTTDRRTFVAKAYDAGDVLPWTFGVVSEVKDVGRADRLANNVTSSEAMPMHYDGQFKFLPVKNAVTGETEQVSSPPRFQYFVAKTPSPPNSGYTLFASSRLFFQHLPPTTSYEALKPLAWDCKNSGFWDNHMRQLPLVVPHPTYGEARPCVRWHQPWPMWKTQFAHCKISIEDVAREESERVKQLVDAMLYDRRVCLYWEWEQGDLLVSDNFGMLHTRTAFKGDSDRELWRIHFD